LGGAVIGLQAKNNPSFGYFANRFMEKYESTTDPESIQRLKIQLAQSRSFVVGSEAPDFTQKTPEGEDLSLSDLRGKVVLIDFWASWCMPCRQENPAVVKMYNKYKDKGFTVYSVSLDKEKSKWLSAIQQDGLIWPNHVSDLKFWQSASAQTYGITSIPFTVLIDKDGKIIDKNLRGAQLEAKLKEILGS
jgi:peroxiredoxin